MHLTDRPGILSVISVLRTFKIFEACADFLTPDGLGSCRKRRNFGAHPSLVRQVGCVATTHREAERCVIASSTHPTSSYVMRLRLGRAGISVVRGVRVSVALRCPTPRFPGFLSPVSCHCILTPVPEHSSSWQPSPVLPTSGLGSAYPVCKKNDAARPGDHCLPRRAAPGSNRPLARAAAGRQLALGLRLADPGNGGSKAVVS